MDIDMIIAAIVAAIPTVTAVIAIIASVVKMLGKFKEIRNEFAEKTDYKELQKTVSKLVDENLQLKNECKRLQTQIDKVHRE